MASEVCRICLCVNVRMFVLKKTCLQNLYKTLTNILMDENEGPIIVCFTCHARLIRCKILQQQAIESNAVLKQSLAGESMSIPKPHEARDEIQFTPICHIDIRPVECDIENDCKDEIFSLESVKVEQDNFEIENSKLEENGNHETETAKKQEDLEIDAYGDQHTDLDDDLPLIAFESKKKEKSKTGKLKKECRNNKKDVDDIEQHSIQTNNFSKPFEKKIKSNSTDCNINNVHKGNLNLESPNIKLKPKLEKDGRPVIKKGKHPGKIVQVYCCNNCDYKSTDRANFQRHMKMHSGEKRYSCNICEYRCNTKSHLQMHMKTHTGEKPFSCDICEYKCRRKTDLIRHIKIHTGEKPFSCHICEYRCIRNSTLQSHIKVHSEEKPFSCNICGYKCKEITYLTKHIKIHTGEKPFSCNICEYRCIRKSSLQSHMKIHTSAKSSDGSTRVTNLS